MYLRMIVIIMIINKIKKWKNTQIKIKMIKSSKKKVQINE